jgi:hypothetical protein
VSSHSRSRRLVAETAQLVRPDGPRAVIRRGAGTPSSAPYRGPPGHDGNDRNVKPKKIIMARASRRIFVGDDAPSGIRTRATTLKGWRPRPLVDGGQPGQNSDEPCLHWPCGPVAQLVEQGTFNPKVAGSRPARPIRNCLEVRDNFDNRVSDAFGMGLKVPSHRERPLHLGRLEFPLGTLPVSVDVGCHFER